MARVVPKIAESRMLFPKEAYTKVGITDDFCLFELKDFQGLLPKAHAAGVPVFALTDEQIGYTGSLLENLKENRDKFFDEFKGLANKVIGLVEYAKCNESI